MATLLASNVHCIGGTSGHSVLRVSSEVSNNTSRLLSAKLLLKKAGIYSIWKCLVSVARETTCLKRATELRSVQNTPNDLFVARGLKADNICRDIRFVELLTMRVTKCAACGGIAGKRPARAKEWGVKGWPVGRFEAPYYLGWRSAMFGVTSPALLPRLSDFVLFAWDGRVNEG